MAFIPYATIFKLKGHPKGVAEDSLPVRHVECVKCGWECELSDLLDGELEEDSCPSCSTTADEYWRGKHHREVPNYA